MKQYTGKGRFLEPFYFLLFDSNTGSFYSGPFRNSIKTREEGLVALSLYLFAVLNVE